MTKLARRSYSIEQPLEDAFEKLLKDHGYSNRSEFIRDMIREKLVRKEWKEDKVCLGTITLIYNHNKRALSDRLTKLQHRHFHSILAATHVHLDHDLCAEAILVRAKASEIQGVADLLAKQKGVLHTALSLGTLGRDIPGPSIHRRHEH